MICMAARTAFLEVRVFPLGVRNSGFSRSDQNTILIKVKSKSGCMMAFPWCFESWPTLFSSHQAGRGKSSRWSHLASFDSSSSLASCITYNNYRWEEFFLGNDFLDHIGCNETGESVWPVAVFSLLFRTTIACCFGLRLNATQIRQSDRGEWKQLK